MCISNEKDILLNFLVPLSKNEKNLHFESVETGSQNIGFPDVVYFKQNRSGCIELKYSKLLCKGPITIKFQPGQLSKLTLLQTKCKFIFVLLYVNGYLFLISDIKRTYENIDDLKKSSKVHFKYSSGAYPQKFIEAL